MKHNHHYNIKRIIRYFMKKKIQLSCLVNKNSIIIIQFNSIIYYLCAESTVTRPIIDTAQRRYKNSNIVQWYSNNNNNNKKKKKNEQSQTML
jgi:hypothetical protein